jgi:hypothetical protein
MSDKRIWADDDPHSRDETRGSTGDHDWSDPTPDEALGGAHAGTTATLPRSRRDVRPGPAGLGHVAEHGHDDWWRVWLRRTTIALGATLVLASLLVWAWVGGLHGGHARDVPVGVIRNDAAAIGAVTAVRADNGTLRPIAFADAADADRALARRKVSAILASDATGLLGGLNLTVATAAGPGVAEAVAGNITAVANTFGVPLTIEDAYPTGADDPDGTTPFWLTMAWIIGGALAAIILGVALGTVPRDLDRLSMRLAALAVFSLLLGLIGSLFALMVWSSHWFGLWLTGSLITFTAAVIASAFQSWLGMWGIGLTVLLLLVLGVPGAGGVVASELLPAFFRGGHRWLPTGLGTDLVRGLEYFGRNANGWPITGLTLWCLASIAALVGSTIVLGKHARQRVSMSGGSIGSPDTVAI